MSWIIGAALLAILIIFAVYHLGMPCPEGGNHRFETLVRVHGTNQIYHRVLWIEREYEVDAYVEVCQCLKCKGKAAFTWTNHPKFGRQPVDLAWAEEFTKPEPKSESLK